MLKHIPASPLTGPLGGPHPLSLGGPLSLSPLGSPLGGPAAAGGGGGGRSGGAGPPGGNHGHGHHGHGGALRGNPLSAASLSLPLSPRTLSPRTPSLSRSLHSHLSTASGSPAGPSPAGPSPSGASASANHSPGTPHHHAGGHPGLGGHLPHGALRPAGGGVHGGHSIPNGLANGGLHISRISTITSPSGLAPPGTPGAGSSYGPVLVRGVAHHGHHPAGVEGLARPGVQEALGSLGLVCVSALLLALLALLALLQLAGPPPLDLTAPDEYVLVHEAALALCALALSLDLSCLLVCAVQFLFAVKLARSPHAANRTDKYLRKSATTRVCAVGGFFVSIPVFLTGIILYTFIQFHSTPAIVTSVLIGVGIIFCGCAMVHNVFVWQKEKTNAVRQLGRQQQEQHRQNLHHHMHQLNSTHWMNDISKHTGNGSLIPGVPPATLDLSSVTTTPHELSTLV